MRSAASACAEPAKASAPNKMVKEANVDTDAADDADDADDAGGEQVMNFPFLGRGRF
jgi:hypothetical protein